MNQHAATFDKDQLCLPEQEREWIENPLELERFRTSNRANVPQEFVICRRPGSGTILGLPEDFAPAMADAVLEALPWEVRYLGYSSDCKAFLFRIGINKLRWLSMDFRSSRAA